MLVSSGPAGYKDVLLTEKTFGVYNRCDQLDSVPADSQGVARFLQTGGSTMEVEDVYTFLTTLSSVFESMAPVKWVTQTYRVS